MTAAPESLALFVPERKRSGLSRLPRRTKGPLRFGDPFLIALVKGPLPDPFRPHQTGLHEDAQVLAGGGLADAELLGNEDSADAVADEVTVDLLREVPARILEPAQDFQALLIGQGLHQIDR